jgi:hypothetical protein
MAMKLMWDCADVANEMEKIRHRCVRLSEELSADKEPDRAALAMLAVIEEQLRRSQTVVASSALKLVLNHLQKS